MATWGKGIGAVALVGEVPPAARREIAAATAAATAPLHSDSMYVRGGLSDADEGDNRPRQLYKYHSWSFNRGEAFLSCATLSNCA